MAFPNILRLVYFSSVLRSLPSPQVSFPTQFFPFPLHRACAINFAIWLWECELQLEGVGVLEDPIEERVASVYPVILLSPSLSFSRLKFLFSNMLPQFGGK